MQRLQKFLSNSGIASRRACEQYILDGRVKVNGKVVTELGTKVSPEDVVLFDDAFVTLDNTKYYYVINKPLGVVTTNKDQFKRPDINTLISRLNTNLGTTLKSVGRLDMYTTGALLLTNDGDLINKLIHPKFDVEKTYLVTLNKKINNEQIKKLQDGVTIDVDGKPYLTNKAKVKVLANTDEKTKIAITICEGKNRQIRKMVNAVNLKVLALHRSSFAGIKINDLKPGFYRELTISEVKKLKELTSKD